MSGYFLRLYIAGKSMASQRAEQDLANLQRVIRRDCQFEIIDVLKNPDLAEQAGILATPTLSYEHPERPRRIIGDLSDTKRVLHFLGIESKEIRA